MRYEDALKIGTAVEGYVRGTYAELREIGTNNFMYTLQRSDCTEHSEAHVQASEALGEIRKRTTDDMTSLQYNKDSSWVNNPDSKSFDDTKLTDTTIKETSTSSKDQTYKTTVFIKDFPVVKAVGALYGGENIEVLLTPYAQDVMLQNAKKKETKEHIEAILSKNTTFMVKEVAIDWFPTNIDAVVVTDKDGKTVTLNDALEKAKKRLDQAKAILAAAGTFAIF